MTAILADAEPLSRVPDAGLSEQHVRVTLKSHGFRLSQRNGGFVVIDGDQRYVLTGLERGTGPDISLREVLTWFSGITGAPRSR